MPVETAKPTETPLSAPDAELTGISRAFDIGARKIERNLPDLVAEPASWGFDVGGDYASRAQGFHEISNWTTSFFTGMALVAFLRTGDERLVSQVEALDGLYREKLEIHARETMHDLGFLYSLYSVALYKVTGKAEHRETGLKAAETLATRFVSQGGYLRAWGRIDEPDTEYAGLAIIDSLMNLSLLYWASDESGDPRFREIAIKHTDTTLEHFIRDDHSVFHAFRFDPTGGHPLGGDNYCGRAVDSHWARGTSWAMYGFALGYQHTGDIRYWEAAIALSGNFASLLDEEGIPIWDFRLGDNEARLRDSSSAAVAVCAIQSLASQGQVSAAILECKSRMLAALCSDDYLDDSPACRGLLKQGQVGDGMGMAINAYTSWGDYFLLQALGSELGLSIDWW